MRSHIVTRDSPGATLTVKINSSLTNTAFATVDLGGTAIYSETIVSSRREVRVHEEHHVCSIVNKFMYMIQ